jgi:hypothetical protein
MKGRSVFFLLIFTTLISAGVTYALLTSFGPQGTTTQIERLVTFEVRVSDTPNSTIPVIVVENVLGITPAGANLPVTLVTVPPPPGTQIANIPTGLFETPDLTRSPVPTIDSTLLVPDSPAERTVTALPEGCLPHVVQEGDTPFGIAQLYGADGFRLLAVNGLTEETAISLQIGDVIIVPLEGCPLEAPIAGDETEEPTATPTGPTPTFEVTLTASVTPTVTLAPTAASAQIEIVDVIRRGDITAEGVRIRNNGATVNVTGWELSDSQGNVFSFPEQLLFSNAEVTVFTREGQNTPANIFWGRDEAVWGEPGDVLTLRDADGDVQASLRLE